MILWVNGWKRRSRHIIKTMHEFRDVVVNKPWGFEYLVYESSEVALWLLHIKQGESTSLHCHPLKNTGFLLLQGEAELEFLADKKQVVAPEKQMIRRGLFHKTRALSKGGIYLFEIENPNDKEDLVRLSDFYGRSSDGYEQAASFEAKPSSYLSITEPDNYDVVEYNNDHAIFSVQRINKLEYFQELNDTDIIMFLRGGIGKEVSGRNHLATVPGDIGRASIVGKVAAEMEFVSRDTLVLRVSA